MRSTGRHWGGLAAAALAACTPAPRPARPAADAGLARIRAAAEALLTRQTERQWRAWALGEPAASALAPDFWLVAPATIDRVRRAVRQAPTRDQRRAWLALHRLFVAEHLQHQLGETNHRRAALEKERPSHGEVRLASLSIHLQREPDPLRRRQLAESFQPLLTELAELARKRQGVIAAASARLGYASRARLATTLRGYPIARAEDLAEALLEISEPLFLGALLELAPARCALPAGELGRPDFARLQPLADLPADDALWPAVQASLAGAGLTLDAAVHLDNRATPDKNPRAATFPLRLPGDIRISLSPTGSLQDAPVLLHELGHALHFAHTRVPLFELAQLGDGSLAEGFAFLFESLADDPQWLRATFGIDEPQLTELARFAGLHRLLTARRHAARLLFALEVWRRPARDPAELFAAHFGRAYGVTFDEADRWWWPVELEDYAESADYLRGQLFAAALAEFLTERFGVPWWKNPRAGAWLAELWSTGQRDPLEVVLARLGLAALPLEPLITASAKALLYDARLPAQHSKAERQ